MLGARTLHEPSDKHSRKSSSKIFFLKFFLVEDPGSADRGKIPRRELPVDNLFLDEDQMTSKSSSEKEFSPSTIVSAR
jgi:hypothetical protein